MAGNTKIALIVGLIALIIVVTVIVIGTSAYLLMDTRPKVKYVRVEKKNSGRTYPTNADIAWGGVGDRGTIQLAEVVVWSNGKNVAPQGKASQSSTCYKGSAKFAIDSNTSGQYGYDKGSVIHTCSDNDTVWWEVELDKEYPVESVEIYNRTDCCWMRLDGAVVKLLDKNRNILKSFNLKGIKNPQKFTC